MQTCRLPRSNWRNAARGYNRLIVQRNRLGHRLNSTTSTSSSVDQSEISHFNALASSWWDAHGSSRLLHLMNPIRHEFLRGCLAAAPPSRPSTADTIHGHGQVGLHLLDVGCGGGIFAESAARLPQMASVTAIDPSAGVLKIADAHRRRDPALASPSSRLVYMNSDIESLASSLEQLALEARSSRPKDNKFDIVSLFEVIEHVPQPSAFLEQVGQHVKPGGWLVLSTIARTWTSWAVTKLVAEDIMGLVPRGTHDWHKYINEHELRDWFAARPDWERPRAMGVVYVPGVGWREVPGSEQLGNYFFGIRKRLP